MGYQISKILTVPNTGANLLTLLKAAGYTGPAILPIGGTLLNTDAAIECYFHANGDSSTAPGTGTDGEPFGPASLSKAWSLARGLDLSGVWLFAGSSSIAVKAVIY